MVQGNRRLFPSQGERVTNTSPAKHLAHVDREGGRGEAEGRARRLQPLARRLPSSREPSSCAGADDCVGCSAFLNPSGRNRGSHGSTLPVLRKDPDDRPPDQPRPQRHEPEVASEPEGGPGRRRRRHAARARLHPVHSLRKTDQARRPRREVGLLRPFAGLGDVVLPDDFANAGDGLQAREDLLEVLQV